MVAQLGKYILKHGTWALNGCAPSYMNYISIKLLKKNQLQGILSTLGFHPLISSLKVCLFPFTGYLSWVGCMFLVPRELS